MLIDSWSEYKELLESGAYYALDLSHIRILAFISKQREHTLLQEMLASDKCIEIHVSHNDGLRDQHDICDRPVWWLDILEKYANPQAVIFSEGNHKKQKAA